MQTKKSLLSYDRIKAAQVNQYLDQAVNMVIRNLDSFTSCFPDSNSTDHFYPRSENVEWTTGFWTGSIWLSYERSGDIRLKEAAEIQVNSFLDRITRHIDVDHHDMGFLYTLSCVSTYKLTGNETARKAAIMAADHLLLRFQEKGQFFQAWGKLGEPDHYRLIIDCLLNMPLLFWASEVTASSIYAEKAQAHIHTAMNYVIRPDDSTYHTYFFDPDTGGTVKGVTHQGNRDGSAWSRGQAWGIYGSALSYKVTKNQEYINIFIKLADYLPVQQADYYQGMAERLVFALADRCMVSDRVKSNGLLLHGTYARATKNNPCTDRGVDECNVWGDYFFLEALTRLSKSWDSYW